MSTKTHAKPFRLAHHLASTVARRALRHRLPSCWRCSSAAQSLAASGAGAATGHAFILGRTNAETSTAKLSDSRGAPLSLTAPENKAPLIVNRSVMVKNLNAQYLGGLSASSVKFTGGDGFVAPNADVALEHNTNLPVAGTGPLPAGIYYVTATALIDLTAGDFAGECSIFRNHGFAGGIGGGDGTQFVQAVESLTVELKSGSTLQESCDVSGTGDGSEAIDGSTIAIRILASSGTKPPA